MELKRIVKEFKKKLPKDINVYEDSKEWDFYASLCGHCNNLYFSIYFTKPKGGLPKIEIASTTDNPLFFVKMIKEIDEKAIVTYCESTLTEISL